MTKQIFIEDLCFCELFLNVDLTCNQGIMMFTFMGYMIAMGYDVLLNDTCLQC